MNEPTYNGKKLPFVSSIRIKRVSNLSVFPLPTEGADKVLTFDLTGHTRIVTMNGKFVGSVAVRQAGDSNYHGVDTIEALLDSQKDDDLTKDLTLDEFGAADGTKKVKILSFDVMSDDMRHFGIWDYIIEFVETDA